MDNGGQRENGRQKSDQYKAIHSQWMIPQHQMKEQYALTMKQIMAIMAERDAAVQERNLVIAEKKAAVATRDMAILQRDAAISERNSAIMERDNALAALEYRENVMNGSSTQCPPGCNGPRGSKHMHRQHHHHQPHLAELPYHARGIHITEAIPISAAATSQAVKPLRAKRMRKETTTVSLNKSLNSPRKGSKKGENLNKVTIAKTHEWRNDHGTGGGEDQNKQPAFSKIDWKGHDLGLNQVTFDDSTMPVPVCSCTGVLQQCYKWGNGGFQSACCTTKLSMYPLPAIPNKRHARVGGRKMTGSAFTKLLSRLASGGHDLSTPLDLKDHWAKHGTNRYITIK